MNKLPTLNTDRHSHSRHTHEAWREQRKTLKHSDRIHHRLPQTEWCRTITLWAGVHADYGLGCAIQCNVSVSACAVSHLCVCVGGRGSLELRLLGGGSCCCCCMGPDAAEPPGWWQRVQRAAWEVGGVLCYDGGSAYRVSWGWGRRSKTCL